MFCRKVCNGEVYHWHEHFSCVPEIIGRIMYPRIFDDIVKKSEQFVLETDYELASAVETLSTSAALEERIRYFLDSYASLLQYLAPQRCNRSFVQNGRFPIG